MPPSVIRTLAEAKKLDLAALPDRTEPTEILMCSPSAFEVKDVKNNFMEGNLGTVDRAKAWQQWQDLLGTFEDLGKTVHVLPGVSNLEDMVFCANQMLPAMRPGAGRPVVVPAQMWHESRRREVPYFERWFRSRRYRIERLSDPELLFEGQGDALWHPGKQLLWGGYGHRTSLETYKELATMLDVPVITLELPTPDFYHLDTCFCLLDAATVMLYPPAFSTKGLALIEHFFPRRIEVSKKDAYEHFACNATALDGETVVLQKGAKSTVAALKKAGFKVVEVDTSEFLKAGGSVFCMKMMVYAT